MYGFILAGTWTHKIHIRGHKKIDLQSMRDYCSLKIFLWYGAFQTQIIRAIFFDHTQVCLTNFHCHFTPGGWWGCNCWLLLAKWGNMSHVKCKFEKNRNLSWRLCYLKIPLTDITLSDFFLWGLLLATVTTKKTFMRRFKPILQAITLCIHQFRASCIVVHACQGWPPAAPYVMGCDFTRADVCTYRFWSPLIHK